MSSDLSPSGAQPSKKSIEDDVDAKGVLRIPTSNNDDLKDEDEAPAPPKPNGSTICDWCNRTREGGCLCRTQKITEADKAEMARTHAIALRITEDGKEHDARIAALAAEAAGEETEDTWQKWITVKCRVCGEEYPWAANDSVDLCGKHRAEEYRRTHREPPIKCGGACNREFPKPLLNEQGMCGACAEPTKILYQALSGPKGEETHKFSVMGHLASSVIMEPIRWIWEQRFPAGKLALLNGPQGGGKTMVFTDIAARVSSGMDWPDGAKNTLGPRKVIFAATEDDEKDTTVPRLVAAGANLDNIIILDKIKVEQILRNKGGNVTGVKTNLTLLDLSEHTKLLKCLLTQKYPDASVVLLDPITAFLGVDETKDKETRPVLESVAEAMRGTLCTVIGIIHSNKMTKGSAGDKVKGGSSMLGVTRTAWAVGRDPEDKHQRYMALIKGNVLKKEGGIKFTIGNKVVDAKNGIEAGYVVWGEEMDEDANDMLSATRNKANGKPEESDSKLEAAKTLLLRELKDDGWRLLSDIHRIREKEGIGETTLKRARYALGVIYTKTKPCKIALAGTEPEPDPTGESGANIPDHDVL